MSLITCNKCNKVENGIKYQQCSRCKIALYCGRECQVEDWKDHKPICLAAQKALAQESVRDYPEHFLYRSFFINYPATHPDTMLEELPNRHAQYTDLRKDYVLHIFRDILPFIRAYGDLLTRENLNQRKIFKINVLFYPINLTVISSFFIKTIKENTPTKKWSKRDLFRVINRVHKKYPDLTPKIDAYGHMQEYQKSVPLQEKIDILKSLKIELPPKKGMSEKNWLRVVKVSSFFSFLGVKRLFDFLFCEEIFQKERFNEKHLFHFLANQWAFDMPKMIELFFGQGDPEEALVQFIKHGTETRKSRKDWAKYKIVRNALPTLDKMIEALTETSDFDMTRHFEVMKGSNKIAISNQILLTKIMYVLGILLELQQKGTL